MSRRYPRPVVPAAAIAEGAYRAMSELVTDTDHEDPMPIKFTSVTLHKTVPRLDSGKGQATQATTFFDDRAGVAIEYDPATCLVRISKGDVAVYIPREGVERFGPTVEDAKREAESRAALARKQAEANALAAAEADAAAQQPA